MWLTNANKIVYTGPIDKFFDYKHGALEYRSLRFENEIYNIDNFQGNAVVNYIDSKYEFTRIIEHKHFEFGMQPKTVITKEFPKEFVSETNHIIPSMIQNNRIYSKYKSETEQCPCVIFGGRLAEYKYYDMHQVISSALKAVDLELGI